MNKLVHDDLKRLINYYSLPTVILSVTKTPDGSCGDIRFFAVNDAFRRSFYCVFAEKNDMQDIKYENFEGFIEGKLYNEFLPKEPKFEDLVFNAAWKGEHTHTYVDTTMLYGYWTEDILLPINTEDDNIAYCQFMYSLSKEMDPDLYSSVSPEISNFVIKTCLEINTDTDFQEKMDIVTKDIREFTNSFAACMIAVDKKNRTFKIISENLLGNMFKARDAFRELPYDIIECWDNLLSETNAIIIKDEFDMKLYEDLAPEWVKTLRRDEVKTLCLVPFTHEGEILGYLYIANFDTSEILRLKRTIELVSYFLSSEFASYSTEE